MSNKKISTSIGVIVIIIIVVAVGVFIWKYEEDQSAELALQTSFQMKKIDDLKKESGFEISDEWTLISHYNFWSNPNIFPRRAYNFPSVEFSYPSNWEFRCCGDMDHASEHFINPSKNRDKSLPYIRIIDYVLSGCPNSQNTCSLDKMIEITANEKFNRLITVIPNDQILQEIKLKKLNTGAFVYKKMEKDGGFSKAYIINLGDDVIEVDFVNYELLDKTFIENFLNRISFESK